MHNSKTDRPSGTLLKSFGDAFAGLVFVLRHQRNARIHVVAATLVVLLGLLLGLSRIEWALLMLTIGGVMAAEIANTAIEAVVDLLAPEFAERAKVAKDTAAGGVLVLALTAVVMGLLILGPPLLVLLHG